MRSRRLVIRFALLAVALAVGSRPALANRVEPAPTADATRISRPAPPPPPMRPRRVRALPPAPGYRTVVISGLHPEALLDTPRSVEVLDGRRLLELAPRSTPEALGDVPAVVVQKTNHGGGSPIVRGFMGQQVLLLLDGIRLNNGTTRYGPNQILATVDPFGLQRIELLRGPGSILHGSDAVGGALDLVTREAPFTPGARLRGGAALTARFSTADQSHAYDLFLHGQVHRVAAAFGGSFKHHGTLVGGRDVGPQPFTGYREGAWDGGVRVHLGRAWFLKLAGSSVRQLDVPRTDRSTPADFRLFTHQDRDLAYVQVTGRAGRYLEHFRTIVSYQRQREERARYRLGRDRIEWEEDDVSTLGLLVVGGTDTGRWSRLVWGVDLYQDWVASDARQEAISTGALTPRSDAFRGRFVDGSRFLQGGVFLQDELRPARWVTLAASGRLAFSHATVPVDPVAATYGIEARAIRASFVGPVGGLSAVFAPLERLRLVVQVQQGFRAPNLDDYSRVDAEGAAFDVPSPDLDRAERSTTFEVGVKWASPCLSAWVFGHYSLLQGFVTRRYTGEIIDGMPAAVRVNAGDGYLAGVEAFLEWRLPRGFSLRGWVSFSQGDLSVEAPEPATYPMSRVAPLQGSFALTWQHRRRYWAEATLRWSARQDRLAPIDYQDDRICPDGPDRCDGTPGHAVLGVAGGIRLSRHATVVLRLENLGNAAYKLHGSGVYAPGVSGTAELRLSR